MKKIITLILALTLAFSLVGCNTSQTALNEAEDRGYRKGYDEGYDAGYSEGLDAGISDWMDAYDRGYSDGKAVASRSTSSANNSGIYTYGDDVEAILDYIRDNPHEFNLYTERDLELAYDSGLEDADW